MKNFIEKECNKIPKGVGRGNSLMKQDDSYEFGVKESDFAIILS
jgi:hypothetical protein